MANILPIMAKWRNPYEVFRRSQHILQTGQREGLHQALGAQFQPLIFPAKKKAQWFPLTFFWQEAGRMVKIRRGYKLATN